MLQTHFIWFKKSCLGMPPIEIIDLIDDILTENHTNEERWYLNCLQAATESIAIESHFTSSKIFLFIYKLSGRTIRTVAFEVERIFPFAIIDKIEMISICFFSESMI